MGISGRREYLFCLILSVDGILQSDKTEHLFQKDVESMMEMKYNKKHIIERTGFKDMNVILIKDYVESCL